MQKKRIRTLYVRTCDLPKGEDDDTSCTAFPSLDLLVEDTGEGEGVKISVLEISAQEFTLAENKTPKWFLKS